MKIHDFKRVLKDNANQVSLEDKSVSIIQEIEKLPLDSQVFEAKKNHKAPIFMSLAFSVCASIGVIAIGVITTLNNPNNVTDKIQLSYAKQIASLTNLLVSQENDKISKSIKRKIYTNDEYDKIAKEINHYLYTIEQFNEDSFVLSLINDQLNIKYDSKEYKFSYQEQEINSYKYSIEGEVEFGDYSYFIKGERIVEHDETNISMRMYLNENEYFLVEQEIELHENEYTYSHFIDNKEIESISLEIEDKSTELSITKNNVDIVECEFEYEKGKFMCEYSSSITNDDELDVQIDSKDDSYIYTFETGYKKELKKI